MIDFLDGTTVKVDVLLGTDGLKSIVRRYTADSYSADPDPFLKFSNKLCFRTLFPASKAVEAGVQTDFQERPICYVGKNKHIVVFTVRGGSIVRTVYYSREPPSR